MGDNGSNDNTAVEGAVELPARLVFSLLKAAVRVAARVEMPLGRLTDLLRHAYFLEYRRHHPRDLSEVAERLGVSIRTAGSLNRALKGDFFAPENLVEPVRVITAALSGQPMDVAELAAETDLEEVEVRRVVTHLLELGWLEPDEGERVRLAAVLYSYVTEDIERRIDGVNHQLGVIADSVWTRFVKQENHHAGARSWSFQARPDDVAEAMEQTFRELRARAVRMEEAAVEDGAHDRYGITVAFAPLEEDG